MQEQRKAFWVGLLLIMGMVSAIFLALQVSGLEDWYRPSEFEVKAYFEDIGGLKPRSRITMSGVTIGRIRRIAYDAQGYRAEVYLGLEGQMRNRIPKDSAASIRTAGLLGDSYVAIEPGGDIEMMGPGDTFHETHSALVLERLVSQFLFNKDK